MKEGYWGWWIKKQDWGFYLFILMIIGFFAGFILLFASIFYLPSPFNFIPSGIVVCILIFNLCKMSYDEYKKDLEP